MKGVSLERENPAESCRGLRKKFMRNLFRKICVFTAAATLAVSAAAFTACDYVFTPLTDNPPADAEVSSQGGFVVEKGDYVYFINGVETYTSDNTYGTPVKGALMRAKMSDIRAGENNAETVIPSLMVAADYTSGIYIYGDRIYYATPNNVINTAGTVDNTYLDFKSVSLDGSDVRDYFRISDNAALYRFVEVGETVYVVYEMDDTLISYNTADGTSTDLARSVSAYAFNSADKSDPYIYYTMSVTDKADSDSSYSYNYNQIYRVRADAVEAPYEYTWDQEWLDENNDGEPPYWNLGELVLDGISVNDDVTQFNHDVENAGTDSDNRSIWRYNYTLQSYTNEGIYFVRTAVPDSGSSVGTSGELYYLAAEDIDAESWNAVTGNTAYGSGAGQSADGKLEVVAAATDTSNASSSAYFYIEEDEDANVRHHYLYVNSDSEIRRVDVVNDGQGTKATFSKGGHEEDSLRIATGATSGVLVALDTTSSDTYDYVYYTCTTDNGLSVERAVFNGEPEYYGTLTPADDEVDRDAYKSVRVLEVEHVSGWYNYEVVGGVVFYANAETFSSTAYSYIWTVDLNGENGLMDNARIKAFNELYGNMMDDTDGYIAELTADGNTKLATALRYFFYTGETQQFYDNIEESVGYGKRNTYLYSEEEQAQFKAFTEGTSEDAIAKLGENYLGTSVLSYYTHRIGAMTESDAETYAEYWQTTLERYTEADTSSEGLPGWAWALIGVAIGVVVIGAGLAVFFIVRAKKKPRDDSHAPLMEVDTTDDRDVDVYTQAEAVKEELTPEQAEEATEAPAEEAEAIVEGEVPAEESVAPADAAPEAPAEEDGASAPETPDDRAAEDPAGDVSDDGPLSE